MRDARVHVRRSVRHRRAVVTGLLLVLPAAAATAWPAAADRAADSPAPTLRYSEHIRPILSNRCFECHGPDRGDRAAGLRLDDRDSATADRGGYAAIVPGSPEASELWRRVNSEHADERMPPPESGKKPLTNEERSRLRRWIEAGAEYEPHWSYVAPERTAVPRVRDEAWSRNEVDRFVLARLEAVGIEPSPPANDETLLRRLFLDVTGLPPTPAETDAFLADTRADAYERWVDRLFEEEPYRSRSAEHRASSWLDAARYGDTSGIHMDNGRQIWLWRDWVLAALRDNMPYDRFVTEQLAGDLLPDATVTQRIASGFNRNHVTTDEGGAISEEYLIEYAVDRASTTSSVFLGLTMGCARCHDHKFDPVSHEEFYEFLSFFRSIEEPGLYSQTADSNRAYEPFLEAPTPEQEKTKTLLAERIGAIEREMAQVPPEAAAERTAYMSDVALRSGTRWTNPEVLSAMSSDTRVTLEIQPDGSIQASGPMPATEEYEILLRTEEPALRTVLLEALPTPGAGPGAGRAFHGNAVISRLTVEVRPADTDDAWQPVAMRWAWCDHAQTDRDFDVTNLLREDETGGWAADGNDEAGRRLLCLLADETFGFDEGTELRAKLEFRSPYASHSLGRLRFRLGAISETGIAMLPPALGRWYVAGAFPGSRPDVFDDVHGPETATAIHPSLTFGKDDVPFRFDAGLADNRVVPLPGGVGSNYLGRVIFSPDDREMNVSLGSDDGFRLFVNGVEVAKAQVNRGVAPDQSAATVPLRAGPNHLVLKIVNTGGPSGYYFRVVRDDETLSPGLVAAIMPPGAMGETQTDRLAAVWRRLVSPAYRQAETDLAATKTALTELGTSIPRTMVMKDLDEPRKTFVLKRGQYDHPDETRPVKPGVPAMLGALPDDAPANRLGLARWMMEPGNPLVARVAVNRMWQTIFGTGLVRTSEDLGGQGEWPSHPGLLDWLAVEFRESGWDRRHMLRLILRSSVYRQSSRVRDDLLAVDPDNRLLARYPRRRLSAEQIRDQALYASGLLEERFGGPSVKPYQPDGLWREVAMPNSNTRIFARGGSDELWRRSLYTYWKRASPPPSLQTFDAPTREACVIRRPVTNTPLQALVLWNDVQFVEASRLLAQRTLTEIADDDDRIVTMFRRCTGRRPDAGDLAQLRAAVSHFRERYQERPEDATRLLEIGDAPWPEDFLAADELAAWTVVASSLLSLHETITQD